MPSAYYEVEAEDARTAAENWAEGEFHDRDDEALESEGPCNVREKQPNGTWMKLPPSQWEAEPLTTKTMRRDKALLRSAALSGLRQRQRHGDILRLR